MRRCSALVGSVLVFALLLGVPPGTCADEEAADAADGVVEITTTEGLILEDFLLAIRRLTKMPLLWDPGTKELARARFTTSRNLTAPRHELFGLVRSLLASFDLVLVPIGPQGHQVYRVMAVRDLGGAATLRPSVIELDRDNVETYRTQHGVLVTTTLRTRYLDDLASARPALMAHATRGGIGRIEFLPELPGFAVTDFAPAVVAIRDALQQIDTPPPEPRHPARVTRRIELEHALAEETVAGLAAHLGANLPLPGQEELTPALREAPVLGLRVLADERTNALLVSGSPDRVAEVQEAVTLLDVPADRPSTWIHVYRLKNRAAVPTALALRELAAEGGILRGADDAPPTTIVAHSETNALLMEATPRAFEQLERLLQELDKPELVDAEDR